MARKFSKIINAKYGISVKVINKGKKTNKVKKRLYRLNFSNINIAHSTK